MTIMMMLRKNFSSPPRPSHLISFLYFPLPHVLPSPLISFPLHSFSLLSSPSLSFPSFPLLSPHLLSSPSSSLSSSSFPFLFLSLSLLFSPLALFPLIHSQLLPSFSPIFFLSLSSPSLLAKPLIFSLSLSFSLLFPHPLTSMLPQHTCESLHCPHHGHRAEGTSLLRQNRNMQPLLLFMPTFRSTTMPITVLYDSASNVHEMK